MYQSATVRILNVCCVYLLISVGRVQASPNCAFHSLDGVASESEGVRFIRLREDAQVGKEILRLQAYPRSSVTLKGSDASGDHKFFNLTEHNATTLVVTLARSLERLVDRDVPKNLLKFRILCAGKNEKVEEGSFLSITVYIEDVNDNAPEFLNVPYVIDVDENTSVDSIIFAGVQAFDRDKPNTPNSEVHFSMSTVPEQLSADGRPYFALKSPHRPLLILKRELDFDNGIRQFKLPIFVWDRGTPANQANTTITINVRDVDDLPPKFTEGVYRTKINEFYPMTGTIIRIPLYFAPPIMAFDQDSLNTTIVYEIISGNERQLFRVNSHNGIMYLQKEIDLEEESLPGNCFVLQLEARQKDNPLKKALARIEVEVLDLNDNMPEFEADFYNISIVENLPTGFSVLQVNAIDRDQGENSEFLYNLVENKTAAGAFRIDSRTGWITVRDDRLLDREQRRSIQLKVEALERNPSYLDDKHLKKPGPSMVQVEITLLDSNDNNPKFDHGNLYEFKVPITSAVGTKIGRVAAHDPDEGPNGQLLYELQRPKGSGYIPFRLDNKNGTIYVSGPLRRGRIAVFVEASDQPINPSERRFSLAVITIEVYATIDDQAIDFVGAPYEFWVGANTPLGTSVGQVRTTLIYDGEDEIMYDLLHTYSEGVPFAIEERSGIITVIRELAEFKRQIYNFEAVANYLFANSSKALIVPRSSLPLTTIASTELSDEGVLITNLTIHIVNKPEPEKVSLRPVIEEINMNIISFHVEENVVGGIIGQLLYKNALNVANNELGTRRELTSSSANSTSDHTSGNFTVASRFRSRNRKSKRRFPRRLAGDANLKLRYIIANQQEVINKISITEDGTLLTLIGLDREQQPSYELTVIVEYTTGLVSGAGIYQVNIKVDDVNDNAPKFNALTYVGLINENCAIGTEVSMNQAIQITDADEGLNAEFRVQLQGDYSDQFSIEYINASAVGNASQHKLSASTGAFNIFNLTDQWNDEFKYQELHTSFMQSNFKLSTGPYFRVNYVGKRGLDREKQQLYNMKLVAVDNGGLTGYAHLTILIADVNDNAPIFERISVFKDSRLEIREYNTDMEIYFVESSNGMYLPPATAATMMLAPPPYHIPGSPRLHMDREKGLGRGLGVGEGVGVGVGEGEGSAAGSREKVGAVVAARIGAGERTGIGAGIGSKVGTGIGAGLGVGAGVGSKVGAAIGAGPGGRAGVGTRIGAGIGAGSGVGEGVGGAAGARIGARLVPGNGDRIGAGVTARPGVGVGVGVGVETAPAAVLGVLGRAKSRRRVARATHTNCPLSGTWIESGIGEEVGKRVGIAVGDEPRGGIELGAEEVDGIRGGVRARPGEGFKGRVGGRVEARIGKGVGAEIRAGAEGGAEAKGGIAAETGAEVPLGSLSAPGAELTILGLNPRHRSIRATHIKCPLFAIYEDTPVGAKLLQLAASDEDFGKNAQLHYEIQGEQLERNPGMPMIKLHSVRHFAIDKLSGELTVNYPLAANIEIWLNLSVTDIDGLKDTTCLRFTIIDVNNHVPAFKKSWYSFDTAEGDYKDSVLGQVLAIDMDYGENANISYSLSNAELPFTIKPLSGVLKINGQLDRELRAKYNFQVIASDNAEPLKRLSSSVDVEINVLDINDNRPEFIGYDELTKGIKYIADIPDRTMLLPVYKAYLDRSTLPGMFVKQVNAIDKDYVGNGNGLVLYSILHQELHAPVFQIDSRDGTITTVSNIRGYNDYEHLNVSVIASDLGSPALSATAVVLINLQGQAVTEPTPAPKTPEIPINISVFQHAYYDVQLMENNEAPIEVMRLNLSTGLNAENYRWSLWLEEGLDESDAHPPFEYDAKNMLLYALKPFDREHISRYQLRVRADRLSREARNYAKVSYPVVDERVEGLAPNECRILVRITDENDNSPKFQGNGQPIVAVLPRSASFGYHVTRVSASDADEGLNAEIRYRLLNEPTKLFGIDELTGNIRLLGDLPLDERIYGFDVKATDRMGADDGRSGIVNVFVYIIDESKQVRLVVAGKPVDVERRIDSLTEALSSAIARDVRVRLLEPNSGGLEVATNAYIYAVDPHTNAIVEMEQLHESLAGLQLDALQLQQQQLQHLDGSKIMPRIIELAEFGEVPRPSHASVSHFMGGLEYLTLVLLALISLGAIMAACCYLCLRQKRQLWSQRDFGTSEAGLTYTIAGINQSRSQQRRQRQQRHMQRCSKGSSSNSNHKNSSNNLSQRPTSAFLPESICSSAQTQSTATATEKLEQQLHHHHQQQALVTQQQHHQYLNDQQQREYIDVPLPKSIAKAAQQSVAAVDAPFVLKYNSCQPVNNLNNYETSLFSLHSTGQDSGVEFLSSRELYETSPDSFHSNSKRGGGGGSNPTGELLCPRHAKAHLELRQHPNTDSSDTYEDSLKTDEPLVAHNCRSGNCEHRQHHHLQHPHYQNTKFEKRSSCVRHSFSGVKDDLMQHSPQISLRPRGHALRNSMNDLEQRLHNLEQSFRRPLEFSKSNSLF